jgi:F0F1-type ATP synthase gamma subunit
MPNSLYNYFDFSDDKVDWVQLSVVMRYLLKFDQVIVFYGQFKSIAVQHVEATDIMGEQKQILSETDQTKAAYLFEPSAEEIVRVFSSEIVSSVFEQSVHESQLAKFASRIIHLDQSLEQVESKIKQNDYVGRQIAHKYFSKKQQQRLAGIGLWNN